MEILSLGWVIKIQTINSKNKLPLKPSNQTSFTSLKPTGFFLIKSKISQITRFSVYVPLESRKV